MIKACLGIIMEKNEQRIEEKISRTAEFTCMIRSASFYEKTPYIKAMTI